MKKILYPLLLLLVLSSALALEPEEVPINIDLGGLEILKDAFRPLLDAAQLILGGVFGLYVILILVRIRYERKKVRILERIRYDLDNLNAHFGVRSSREKKNVIQRFLARVSRRLDDRALAKHTRKKKDEG